MEIIGVIIALTLSAFFSGSEIAFVVANRLRVEVLARRSGIVGPLVRKLLHNPDEFLTTTLVGNNVVLVLYSTLMAFYLQPPLEYLFEGQLAMSDGSADVAVLISQTIIASVLVLIVGEVLPKTIMREIATSAVFFLAVPLRITYYVLLPLIKIAGWSASVLVRLFGPNSGSLAQFMRRDFEVIIQESKESGTLDLDEGNMALLTNVFAMSSKRIKESMVPRTGIYAIEEKTPIEVVRDRFIETGHSKMPVYRENIDNIVGMAFAYDLFQRPSSLQEMIRPAKFVPESKKSKDLLREFLSTGTSIAVVIDEYGGTAGLVTREDLLEELFGDIQDEFDVDQEILRQSGENVFTVSGRVHLDELEEHFGIALPEGDYETVAGYLIERLGTIPVTRDEFDLDDYHFVILKSTPSRVDLVRIIRTPPKPGAEG